MLRPLIAEGIIVAESPIIVLMRFQDSQGEDGS